MEHAELIEDMHLIQKLCMETRAQLASFRRKRQLENFNERERIIIMNNTEDEEVNQVQGQAEEGRHASSKSRTRRVRFKKSTILLEAVERNDVEEVRKLVEDGVNLNEYIENGLTPLLLCCVDFNENMLKLLIESGANVNGEESEKWTPLHAAAKFGYLSMVKYLISKGANLLAVNSEGNIPSDLCKEPETLEFIKLEMTRRGITQEIIDEIRALPEKNLLEDMQRLLCGELLTLSCDKDETYKRISNLISH